jgi:GT2 family glycosyltransferase
MPKIGLVTVLYNSDEVLEGFFRSLSAQNFKDYHLYLIDNSPNDKTDVLISILTQQYPVTSYTHLKNPENAGVAKANNQGIELSLDSGADYVLLLNNDIEFYQPHLLTDMVLNGENNEAVIIPKILYFNTRRIWMAGGKLLKTKGYTTHIGEEEEDNGQHDTNAYFDYAPTCFMLIAKHVFKEVGMMDERYFVYFDDTDFMIRAVNKGYKVFYIGNLEVLHKVSSTTGGYETPFGVYYTTRNRLYFIKKNLTGFNKLSAYTYTFLTRLLKLARYDKVQRSKMMAGIIDGIKL